MSNLEYLHPRPELNKTVLFGETPVLDSEAIEAKNGRLIPGYQFSHSEYDKLWTIAKSQDDELGTMLPILQVPTLHQIMHIEITRPYGCWELPVYEDTKNQARYGRLKMPELTKSELAHRVMFLVFYGSDSIPENHVIDHICENKACCYPRHLQPVTTAQNTALGFIARRHAEGQYGFDFDLEQ